VKLAASFACAAITIIGPLASAQEFRIGVIDFYGLKRLSPEELRPLLAIAEGDPISFDDENWGAPFVQTQQQLSKVAGVFRAHVNGFVCCTDGKADVFIGIEERGARRWHFRKPPGGTVRLPPDVVASGAGFTDASTVAMERGDFGEDRSEGHSLAHAPELRRVLLQFVEHARKALAPLSEMAKWKAPARTVPPSKILGRMAHYSADEIASAIEQGRQNELIASATRGRKQPAVQESR